MIWAWCTTWSPWCAVSDPLMCDFSPCVIWVFDVWFQSLCDLSLMCDFSPIWFQILWFVVSVSLAFSSYDVWFEAFSCCDVWFQSLWHSVLMMCEFSFCGFQSLWCVISVSVAFSPYDVWFQFLWLSVLMMCDFSFCGFQSLWNN